MSDRSSLSRKTDAVSSLSSSNTVKTSRSFIDFASAIEMEEKKKNANRLLKRAAELLEIITLDTVPYEIIDIPPMKYETYIRTFGKSDSKQVFIQTENHEDEDIQTDEIEVLDKWTQNPPSDSLGYGGEGLITSVKDNDWKSLFDDNASKLSSFLQKCGKAMLHLLDEESPSYSVKTNTNERSGIFYSDCYYTLFPPDFMKDVSAMNVYSDCNDNIAVIYDGMLQLNSSEKGIICIWNIFDADKPGHILTGNSQPTCATFGPSGSDILIAGMVDGTITLWDLSSRVLNYSQTDLQQDLALESPIYNTAVAVGNENHHSCIVAIQAVHKESDKKSKNLAITKLDDVKSFHLLTMDDIGVINVWIVVEVLKPDASGFESDLGLAPGGKFRLVRSSCLDLCDINALLPEQRTSLRTFDFQVVQYDSSRILVTTDIGLVLQVTRHNSNIEAKYFSSDDQCSFEVRCIACSPHNEDLFLVGCSDGSVKLYNIKLAHPLMIFPQAAKGEPVILLQWSPIQPAVFCVLSSSSHLLLWNILEDSIHPVKSYKFTDSRVTWFMFKSSTKSSPVSSLCMIISKETGEVEIHSYQHRMDENILLEAEYMNNL